MKTQILFLTLTLIVLLTCLLLPEALTAQAPPALPGGNPMQNPIDGGLVLLGAAGGGYAIKKLRDRKEW